MVLSLSDALNLKKVKATVSWQCHRRFHNMDVIKRIGELHSKATFQKLTGEWYIDTGILGKLFIHVFMVLEWRRYASCALILKGMSRMNSFLFPPHSFPAPSLHPTFLPSLLSSYTSCTSRLFPKNFRISPFTPCLTSRRENSEKGGRESKI